MLLIGNNPKYSWYLVQACTSCWYLGALLGFGGNPPKVTIVRFGFLNREGKPARRTFPCEVNIVSAGTLRLIFLSSSARVEAALQKIHATLPTGSGKVGERVRTRLCINLNVSNLIWWRMYEEAERGMCVCINETLATAATPGSERISDPESREEPVEDAPGGRELNNKLSEFIKGRALLVAPELYRMCHLVWPDMLCEARENEFHLWDPEKSVKGVGIMMTSRQNTIGSRVKRCFHRFSALTARRSPKGGHGAACPKCMFMFCTSPRGAGVCDSGAMSRSRTIYVGNLPGELPHLGRLSRLLLVFVRILDIIAEHHATTAYTRGVRERHVDDLFHKVSVATFVCPPHSSLNPSESTKPLSMTRYAEPVEKSHSNRTATSV
eukprot:1885741-Pyramimonas_sp.AAC.1